MKKVKVSFDFDGTLSRSDVQQFAKELISKGYEVWIVTSRASNEDAEICNPPVKDRIFKANEELFKVAGDVGIKREHIIFTNFEWKVGYLENNNFIFHLDDDTDELMVIMENGDSCKPVNVEHFEWRESCEDILKNLETQI